MVSREESARIVIDHVATSKADRIVSVAKVAAKGAKEGMVDRKETTTGVLRTIVANSARIVARKGADRNSRATVAQRNAQNGNRKRRTLGIP